MKKLFFILYLISPISNFINAQTINVYENTDTILHINNFCFGMQNDILFCDAVKLHINNITDTLAIKRSGNAFYQMNTFNIKTLKKNIVEVASELNDYHLCNIYKPIFNKYDGRYYNGGFKLDNLNNPVNFNKFYIESFDTLLTNRKVTYLQNATTNSNFKKCNQLFEKDSIVYAIAFDEINKKPYLCKNSLFDGHLIDTLSLIKTYYPTYTSTFYDQMNWVNDSVISILSDYLHYINVNQMKYLDTVSINWSVIPNILYKSQYKFDISDTSYNFFSNIITYNNNYYKNKIKSNGKISKGNNSIIDSNILNYYGLYVSMFDYYYKKHHFISFLNNTTDTFAIVHTNEYGISDWFKIFNLDSQRIWVINPIALSDSSVIVMVQAHKTNNLDCYYLKLDQNGNIINTPLGINTHIKSINEIIIYPNPSSNQVYIGNINLSSIQSIKIINTNRQIIKALDPTLIIDVKDLSPNIYSIVIQTKEGMVSKQFQKL